MLHEKPVQYNNVPDSTGICADAGSGESSLHSEVRTSSSDSPPAQGDQEDPFFTMTDLEDVIISLEEEMEITKFNNKKIFVFVDQNRILDDESQRQVYERLVRYRLKAHKLSKGDYRDELDDKTLKEEFPDFLRKETESTLQLHFDVHNYFKYLEEKEDGSVGWYFDPEFSKLQDLADYQRLVLKNHDDVEYLNWKSYRLNFSTYEMDKEYVKFCTEMSKKLQWLKKYIGKRESCEWLGTELRGSQLALKIATRYPGVTTDLVHIAYGDLIWSLHNDYLFRDDWDIIFFEIWKLVTKKKLDFTTALMKVKEKNYVPKHVLTMMGFLTDSINSDLQSNFYYCVEGIRHDADDGVAKELIKKAILKLPRKKTLQQYVEKKMEIAENIGLHEDCFLPQMVTYGEDDYADLVMVTVAGKLVESADPVKYYA